MIQGFERIEPRPRIFYSSTEICLLLVQVIVILSLCRCWPFQRLIKLSPLFAKCEPQVLSYFTRTMLVPHDKAKMMMQTVCLLCGDSIKWQIWWGWAARDDDDWFLEGAVHVVLAPAWYRGFRGSVPLNREKHWLLFMLHHFDMVVFPPLFIIKTFLTDSAIV